MFTFQSKRGLERTDVEDGDNDDDDGDKDVLFG